MDVILLERVAKLGHMGEVVSVRPGFARNYLIPQGKALRATKDALASYEQQRAQLEARNLERKESAEALSGSVDGQGVVIIRQASESNQLYGSVNSRDIATAFTENGISLDRQQIRLDHALKVVGIHDVVVALHPEVEVTVKVNIARSQEEADIQAGIAKPVEPETDDEIEETTLDLSEIEQPDIYFDQ